MKIDNVLKEMNYSDTPWDEVAIKTLNEMKTVMSSLAHIRSRDEISTNKDVVSKILDAGIALDESMSELESAIRSFSNIN